MAPVKHAFRAEEVCETRQQQVMLQPQHQYFISSVRLRLSVKLPVRKVAEAELRNILGQPPNPSAANSGQEKEEENVC